MTVKDLKQEILSEMDEVTARRHVFFDLEYFITHHYLDITNISLNRPSELILWTFSLLTPIQYIGRDGETDNDGYCVDPTLSDKRLFVISSTDAQIEALERANGMSIEEIVRALKK